MRERPEIDEHFVAMVWRLVRARRLREAGDREGALAECGRAGELARRGAGVLERAWALIELSQRGIGDALYVSLNTVKSHVRAIYLKLSTDSRAGAVARARELELL